MKFLIILLLVALTLYANTSNTYAWDSTAAKYMPLQVGNVWVYKGYALGYMWNGTNYFIVRITGINDSLGKKYFILENRNVTINGVSCQISYLRNPLRIDSSTMNLISLGGICNNELRIDSLASGLNNVFYRCPAINNASSYCGEISTTNIFNSAYQVKRFDSQNGPYTSTTYASGLGMIYYYQTYSMQSCRDTLKGCVINGILYGDTSTIVGINQLSTEVPNEFSLSQNYPNPFNPTTQIGFRIPESGFVRLTVFDMLGKEVDVLVSKELQPGSYEAEWPAKGGASAYPSGVYYYKLESGSFAETKKMVLIK